MSSPAETPAAAGHVVIVGAGECGARVARELVQGGWPGTVTLVGAEDRPVYERPPLSKRALLDEVPEPVEPYREHPLDADRVTLRLGTRVTSLDPEAHTLTLDGGESLPYDRLVLATGAGSRRLPGLPEETLTLRTYEDALALRSRIDAGGHLLVVGAGLIGLEVAASARQRGLDVTVVEAGPRALGRAVPRECADHLVARHTEEGVRILTDTTVAACERAGNGWSVRLSDGTQLSVDGILAAVGSAPDTTLAEAAGLETEAGGVVVDDRMRTSAPDVYAAGDCVTGPVVLLGDRMRLESWRMAHDQAVSVARSILGQDEPHTALPWFWSDQYDLTLQVAGLATLATRWVSRPRADGASLEFGFDDDGRLVCAAGVGTGAIAKDVKVAEKLMEKGARPDPAALADPEVPLRGLLRG